MFVICMVVMILNLSIMFVQGLITQSDRLPNHWVVFNISNMAILFISLIGLFIFNFKKVIIFLKEINPFDK